MKATKYLNKLAEKRTRNVLAIIAMFACTSICLGIGNTTRTYKFLNVTVTHGEDVAGNSDKADGTANDGGIFPLDPNKRTLTIEEGAIVGQASGAYINDGNYNGDDIVDPDDNDFTGPTMTGNEIIVNGGDFTGHDINGACSLVSRKVDVKGNTAKINAGDDIGNVFGGYTRTGTASDNKAFIDNKVEIIESVYGGYVYGEGDANDNKATITNATVVGRDVNNCPDAYRRGVFGGYVGGKGNTNNNGVTITNATIGRDVLGGFVSEGNTENNGVTITSAIVGRNVGGGFVYGDGNAKDNKVRIYGEGGGLS